MFRALYPITQSPSTLAHEALKQKITTYDEGQLMNLLKIISKLLLLVTLNNSLFAADSSFKIIWLKPAIFSWFEARYNQALQPLQQSEQPVTPQPEITLGSIAESFRVCHEAIEQIKPLYRKVPINNGFSSYAEKVQVMSTALYRRAQIFDIEFCARVNEVIPVRAASALIVLPPPVDSNGTTDADYRSRSKVKLLKPALAREDDDSGPMINKWFEDSAKVFGIVRAEKVENEAILKLYAENAEALAELKRLMCEINEKIVKTSTPEISEQPEFFDVKMLSIIGFSALAIAYLTFKAFRR